MNSSGIKRGMAAFAIAAVAVAGIPALAGTAFADSINQMQAAKTPAVGPDSSLQLSEQLRDLHEARRHGQHRSPAGRRWPRRHDRPSSSTPSTVAPPGSPLATSTRNDDGSFSVEWANPPRRPHSSTSERVDITPGVPMTQPKNSIEVFGNDPNTETVNIARTRPGLLRQRAHRPYHTASTSSCRAPPRSRAPTLTVPLRAPPTTMADRQPRAATAGPHSDRNWPRAPARGAYGPDYRLREPASASSLTRSIGRVQTDRSSAPRRDRGLRELHAVLADHHHGHRDG